MMPPRNINTGIRVLSMLLDHVCMSMIMMVFFAPLMIKIFTKAFAISHGQHPDDGFNGPLLYIALIGFALYFCKDCINGRSIAKRILKLQLIDNKTGRVASPLQCFVRNIFCMIWPVEVSVAMINPARSIGDRVAGTKLVNYDPVTTEQPPVSIVNFILPFILSFALVYIIMQFQSFITS